MTTKKIEEIPLDVATNELDEIRVGKEANYQTSLRLMGDSVSIVQDLIDLYKLLTRGATKSKLVARDE